MGAAKFAPLVWAGCYVFCLLVHPIILGGQTGQHKSFCFIQDLKSFFCGIGPEYQEYGRADSTESCLCTDVGCLAS